MEKQNKTLDAQRIETTFFQLLRVHSDIVRSMDLRRTSTSQYLAGRAAFETLFQRLKDRYRPLGATVASEPRMKAAYRDFSKAYSHYVDHCFKNLFCIVRFMDRSKLSEHEKWVYMVALRAQLSLYELLLLFYHCSDESERKFHRLIVKYDLFKNLPPERLLDESDIEHYKRSDFLDQG